MLFITPKYLPKKLGLIGPIVVSVFWFSSASAYDFAPTELDFSLSPEYCKARFSVKGIRDLSGPWVRYSEAGINKWASIIGPDWRHLHHYCTGKVLLTRLQTQQSTAFQGKELGGKYWRAAEEMEYALKRSSVGSPLYNTMSIDYARAIEGMGKPDDAVKILVKLRESSPKDVAVYIALAQTLKRAGKTKDAIAVLEKAPVGSRSKGAIDFWLAHFYSDVGNLEKARHYAELAENAGIKTDRLKKKLGAQEK